MLLSSSPRPSCGTAQFDAFFSPLLRERPTYIIRTPPEKKDHGEERAARRMDDLGTTTKRSKGDSWLTRHCFLKHIFGSSFLFIKIFLLKHITMFASKNLSSKYKFNRFRAGPLFSARRPPPPPPSPPPASRRRRTRTRSSRRRPARPSGGRRRRRPASAISRISKYTYFTKKTDPHLK